MLGLAVVFFIGLYLIISLLVIFFSARTARKQGRRGWVWGLVAAFVMYNLVFWDWIPTVAMHNYECATEAGYWVYKTPEQWEKENPGVLETLVSPKNAPHTFEGNTDSGNYTSTYITNSRFRWVVKHSGPNLFNLWREEQEFVDVKTGKVLAKYVDFSTSQIRRRAGWSGWKFWLDKSHCDQGEMNQSKFWRVVDALRGRSEK
jgi:hypothetical protein